MHLDALPPGFVFDGDFVVERAYRQTPQGTMYVVRQQSTGREGALIVTRHTLRDAAAASFLEEARLATSLPSAHVVEALALGIDGATGRPWLVIEVVKGNELGQWLVNHGPLSPADLDRFFEQLCEPLGAAHDLGLVHRDVRPLNIFVGEARHAAEPFVLKVRGFGVFRLLAGAPTNPRRTPWSAPELLNGEPPTPSSDVWSLGLLAFHLLTGKMYFDVGPAEADIQPATAQAIVTAPIKTASARAAELGVAHLLPAGFDDWFATCVNRSPLARYSRAQEARIALRHVLSPNPSFRPPAPGGSSAAASLPARSGRRTYGWWSLPAGAAVLAGAVFAYLRATSDDGRAVDTTTPEIRASVTASASTSVFASPSASVAPPTTDTIIELAPDEDPPPPSVSASAADSASPTAATIAATIAAPGTATGAAEHPPFDVVQAKQALNTVNYRSCGLPRAGKVVVSFQANGTVAAVKVAEGGYDAKIGACLERLFRFITVPPFRGARQSMFVALLP